MGFYDIDSATINWAEIDGRYFTFDKDGVFPLSRKFRKLNFDITNGGYFRLLDNSYSIVNSKVRYIISSAMQQDCKDTMISAWLSIADGNLLSR